MINNIETIVVGGGQGGLSTSYHLLQRRREHLVLEADARPASAWRAKRWDSFTLVTPNWTFRLPGADFGASDPDGYMPRDEIAACFERYAAQFRLPVRYNTRVTSVDPQPGGQGYLVTTENEAYRARNVVIGTGLYQRGRRPAFSAALPSRITQLTSDEYRSPGALPPGAVLVVGSGQSGAQIAEELYQDGRQVFLCVGSAGRAPRHYRGKDIVSWLVQIAFFSRPVEALPSPRAKFAANPTLTGRNGGHSLNLHQFARDGVTLLGRLQGGEDGSLWLGTDLMENLARADQFEADLLKRVDDFITNNGLDAPADRPAALRDGFQSADPRQLKLNSTGISTIIWAMGHQFDFGLVHAPLFDDDGFPLQKKGVTAYPGLYFVGLPWLDGMKSGLLMGVGDHAGMIADLIEAGSSRAP